MSAYRHVGLPIHTSPTMYLLSLLIVAATFQGVVAIPQSRPYEKWKRQSASNSTRVDLGYEIYEGVANSSTRLNTFKGCAIAMHVERPLSDINAVSGLRPHL